MGFFKKLPHKATPAELSEVHARLDAQMCGLTQEWALDSLGVERLLPLINIADNEIQEELRNVLQISQEAAKSYFEKYKEIN